MPRQSFKSWKTKRLQVDRLALDPANYRLSALSEDKLRNKAAIIEWMVEHEEIYELAKSISERGYFPNEEPIVVQEKAKYLVLEGNRRVTACLLLTKPDLAPKQKRTSFRRLHQQLTLEELDELAVIQVRVAPSWAEAIPLIQSLHSNSSLFRPWDSIKQARFLADEWRRLSSLERVSEFYRISPAAAQRAIATYLLYTSALKLEGFDHVERRRLEDENDFPITTLWRYASNVRGRRFLGIQIRVDDQILHVLTSPEDFALRYTELVRRVIDRRFTPRTGNTQKEIDDQLNDLAITLNIPADAVLIQDLKDDLGDDGVTYNINDGLGNDLTRSLGEAGDLPVVLSPVEKAPADEEPEPKRRRRSGPNGLIPSELDGYLPAHTRITEVFQELQRLRMEGAGSHLNAVAVLFRCFLEMLLNELVVIKNRESDLRLVQSQHFESATVNKVRGYLSSQHGFTAEQLDEDRLRRVLGVRSPSDELWTPSLRSLLLYVSAHAVELVGTDNSQVIEAFQDYAADKLELEHRDFNKFVHNRYYRPEAPILRDFWAHLSPFVLRVIKTIRETV